MVLTASKTASCTIAAKRAVAKGLSAGVCVVNVRTAISFHWRATSAARAVPVLKTRRIHTAATQPMRLIDGVIKAAPWVMRERAWGEDAKGWHVFPPTYVPNWTHPETSAFRAPAQAMQHGGALTMRGGRKWQP